MVATMQAHNILSNGCMGFLTSTVDKRAEEMLDPTSVSIVKDFVDVFPEESQGLPPKWKISFEIELLARTGPILMVLYCMAPVELKELQTQLQELLDKGYIHPNNFMWGAPNLFVRKKDESFRIYID